MMKSLRGIFCLLLIALPTAATSSSLIGKKAFLAPIICLLICDQPTFEIVSTPPESLKTGQEFTYNVEAFHPEGLEVAFSLTNAPEGMVINPRTGRLTWTPAPGQVATGSVTIVALDSMGAIAEQTLESTVTFASTTYNGLFVSPIGNDANTGTPQSPLATLKGACQAGIAAGQTVYVRGGVFSNPGYGNGEKNNNSMPAFSCSGSAGLPITIRPHGNEQVKFQFDSFNGIRLQGDYLVFEEFEVEGPAQRITNQESIDDWWIGSKIYNGNGIVINGHHVTVRNNIVHDTTGSAIFSNGFGDYARITGNIIYNAAWWSTKGTTGLGLISNSTSDGSQTRNIEVTENLVFASESRIFSRVFRKGFASLEIDEGSGTLIQVNDGDYQGRYLIKDNFYLFNGKGIASARTDKVDIENNTLFMNGSTIDGRFDGLRVNGGSDINLARNAVQVLPSEVALSVAASSNLSSSFGNFYVGDIAPGSLPAGDMVVSELFVDPVNLDFSVLPNIPNGTGADLSVWRDLQAKLKLHGAEIMPTDWQMDRESQTRSIAQNPPDGATVDYSEFNNPTHPKILVTLPSGHPIAQESGSQVFELEIVTPFSPTIPNPPSSLNAVAGDGKVILTWVNSANAVRYDVFYSQSPPPNGDDIRIADAVSGIEVSGLTNGTVYYFAIAAIDQNGQPSELSVEVSAQPNI